MSTKKPQFRRTDGHKKKRLGLKWRKPKGIQNKMRLRKRGYAPVVKPGYKVSEKEYNTYEGKKIVHVSNLTQLKSADSKSNVLIVSAKLGDKKRIELLKEATKAGFKVLNLNPEAKIKAVEDALNQKKQAKQAKLEAEKKEAEKKKAEEKKAEEKKKAAEAKKAEAKKAAESKDQSKTKSDEKSEDKETKDKKELDKLLTKKQ